MGLTAETQTARLVPKWSSSTSRPGIVGRGRRDGGARVRCRASAGGVSKRAEPAVGEPGRTRRSPAGRDQPSQDVERLGRQRGLPRGGHPR